VIGIFGDFSLLAFFQQVSLRLVTHCAGGFFGLDWGGEMVGRWGFGFLLGNSYYNGFIFDLHNLSDTSHIHL
jgi:hypothetical protein